MIGAKAMCHLAEMWYLMFLILSIQILIFAIAFYQIPLVDRISKLFLLFCDTACCVTQENARKTTATLKFINPVKIPASVEFSVAPQGNWAPKWGVNFPFAVYPSNLSIPPHECAYVSITFMPDAIQTYVAILDATVVNGSNPATKGFRCELRGEGTLPSLTLQVRGFAVQRLILSGVYLLYLWIQ